MEKIISMPCLYGVCFYQGTNCACAYVDSKGNSHLVSTKNKAKIIYHNIVFLRGLEYLIFGFYFFVKNLIKFPFEYDSKNITQKVSKSLNISTKSIFTFVVILCGILLSLVLVGIVPIKLSAWICGYSSSQLLNRFVIAMLKVLVLYIILIVLKFFTPFKQFYRFNACSNLILNKNEKITKSTNFLNFIIFSFILSFIVVSFAGFSANKIFKPFINLIISLFCFTISYEILNLIDNSKFSFVNLLCNITCFFITENPTKTEIYIAMSAYNEVLFMQDKKRKIVNLENISQGEVSFSSLYAECKEKFKSVKSIEECEVDWLFCEVLKISRGELRFQTVISEENKRKIESAMQKRLSGEPLTKIFNRAEFFGLEFKVTKDVLSPRMETEILVEKVLKLISGKMTVLDMCTGSGCIAISVAKNSVAQVMGVDISQKALNIAEENAKRNNVKVVFKQSNMFDDLKKNKKFDIIISNPPYIRTKDIASLDIEVKDYDPTISLDGGEDGLDFYRILASNAPNFLNKNGYLVLEIGYDQKNDVKNLLKVYFEDIKVIKDYSKNDRVVIAKLKNKGTKNVRTNNKNKTKI